MHRGEYWRKGKTTEGFSGQDNGRILVKGSCGQRVDERREGGKGLSQEK